MGKCCIGGVATGSISYATLVLFYPVIEKKIKASFNMFHHVYSFFSYFTYNCKRLL